MAGKRGDVCGIRGVVFLKQNIHVDLDIVVAALVWVFIKIVRFLVLLTIISRGCK